MIEIVGLSHRTAPLTLREGMAFARDLIAPMLTRMRAEAGLIECVILSTCNRVELYGCAAEPPAIDRMTEFLARAHGREVREIDAAVYRLSGAAAVRHAFRVAAGLDSMVVGETQILGQVKEAYLRAEEAGTLGAELGTLRNRSLAAAKKARSETGIGRNAVSVSHVAVELARKIFGSLDGKHVLMVGAGKMSELAARHLVEQGARATVLGGRTFERANQLAEALGGRAAPFESLREELARADVVISSTGAPCLVIQREDIAQALRLRHQQLPLFIIDIAVPRDVDPEVRRIENVFLYDLDDLKAVSEANLRERQREAQGAESIVESEARAFLDWQKARDGVPLIAALRDRADEIRKGELQKARRRMGNLSAEQDAALEAAMTALINKLIHPSLVHIKDMAREGRGEEDMALIRRLLGL